MKKIEYIKKMIERNVSSPPALGKHWKTCPEHGEKISIFQKGRKKSFEHIRKISLAKRGKKNYKLSELLKNNPHRMIGKNNPNWRGGISSWRERLNSCSKYIEWRNSVYKRDSYTCRFCGDMRGGNLEAHHLIPVSSLIKIYKVCSFEESLLIKEIFDITNGITLCKKCHRQEHRGKS